MQNSSKTDMRFVLLLQNHCRPNLHRFLPVLNKNSTWLKNYMTFNLQEKQGKLCLRAAQALSSCVTQLIPDCPPSAVWKTHFLAANPREINISQTTSPFISQETTVLEMGEARCIQVAPSWMDTDLTVLNTKTESLKAADANHCKSC